MTGKREINDSGALILYLGLMSGLVGGLVWFLLDTLTRGVSMGEVFFSDIRLKFTFLLLPFFFYSVAGLLIGLFAALLQLALLGKGRSVVLSTLPPHFPLFAFWTVALLLFGAVGWERNDLKLGHPYGPMYLAGIVVMSFLPVYLVLILGRFTGKRPVTGLIGLLIVAAPFLVSAYHLLPLEDAPIPAGLEREAPRAGKEDGEATNVLLITVDTLRRDHMGCYGDTLTRTPEIDLLAREGVLFGNCVVQAPITLPSHSSILTGTYPLYHGVRDNGFYRLDSGARTIAEKLKEHGYVTGAFVSAFPLDSDFGLDQGFDSYDDEYADRNEFFFSRVAKFYTLSGLMRGLGLWRPVIIAERKAEATVDRTTRWLDAVGERPFFLWIHLFDPHNPLDPPDRFEKMYAGEELRALVGSEKDRETIRSTRDFTAYDPDSPEVAYMKALYRAEVTYTDYHLGRLMDRLDDLGLSARTLVVFTADHGQSLFEHGYVGHSGALYSQTIDAPLILRHPSLLPSGKRVDRMVQSVDIYPTIFDLLGLEPPEGAQGRSIVSLIMAEESGFPDRAVYFETLHSSSDAEKYRGLIAGEWKFIRSEDGSEKRLYHVASDPGELIDLSPGNPELVARMETLLEETIAEESSGEGERRIPLDDDTRDILKSLGYVW